MTLSKSVPEDVGTQFQLAQYLLLYSQFQFSLVSVSLVQAIIAVEGALRTRQKTETTETTKKWSGHPGLKHLLSVAIEKEWIVGFDSQFRDHVVEFRNDLTHGSYMLHPPHTLSMVGQCGKLIQQLFP